MFVYDLESWPNIFTATIFDREANQVHYFEVSWRINQMGALMVYLDHIRDTCRKMVGFNNAGYDYGLIHAIMTGPHYHQTAADMYRVNERIINTPWERRFDNVIPEWKRVIPQLDLYLVHHFDNAARSTGLKQLEFVMRSKSIEDLPYPPGVPVPELDNVADTIRDYNIHDVKQTNRFLNESMGAIQFRQSMTEKYEWDFTNFNDTKIGKKYFIQQLELNGMKCFDQNGPIQTIRSHINLDDVIFPYVSFESPEFNGVLTQLKNTTIKETKGALSLSVTHKGFDYVFGLGGIHGSIDSNAIHSDDEFIIVDADVASYYPNLSIKNRLYPQHLSERFCDVYEDVYKQRKLYKKGTTENKALKLALNGVYGDSNSVYSPFYDPQYTMTITVNGQLLLCMLAEQLTKIPGLTMVQINTDGLTTRLPRKYREHYDAICNWWQQLTCLELEFVDYKSMFIRDVNNYIAVPYDKGPKFKGAYVYTGAHLGDKGELEWNKNHSALIVKKAACDALLYGTPVAKTIRECTDIFDFFLFIKVGKKDLLQLRNKIKWGDTTVFDDVVISDVQKSSRYLVTNTGDSLIKVMPPVNRKTNTVDMYLPGWISKKITGMNKNLTVSSENEYKNAITVGYRPKDGGTYKTTPPRRFEVVSGFLVQVYNNVQNDNAGDYDINYGYYIAEAEKLVDVIK